MKERDRDKDRDRDRHRDHRYVIHLVQSILQFDMCHSNICELWTIVVSFCCTGE